MIYSFVSVVTGIFWVHFILLFITFEVLAFIILLHTIEIQLMPFSYLSYSSSKDPTNLMVLDLMNSDLCKSVHVFIDYFVPTIIVSY